MADTQNTIVEDKLEQTEDTTSFLTTIDNPYDPQDQFDEWYVYDQMLGYNTLQRLDKMVSYLREKTRTDSYPTLRILAMAEIRRLDPLRVYTIVEKKSKKNNFYHLKEGELDAIAVGEEISNL